MQQHATAEKLGEFVQVTIEDWLGSRRVQLDDVPLTASVGEILDEACRRMELPGDSSYEIALQDKALNHLDSLAEVGIRADSEVGLIVTPEVQAGQ